MPDPQLLLEPVEVCARFTLLQALLRYVYADAMSGLSPTEREKFRADFINDLRFNMRFLHDDGDVMLQVQAKTVELAESFFRSVLETTGSTKS